MGVVLDSTGSSAAHFAARMSAFERSAHLLMAGVARIPSFTQGCLTYLWASLVVPVVGYGMDIYVPLSQNVHSFQSIERKWWRRLLHVGGRAPNETVKVLMGRVSCTVEWKVRRASLFLRLANAPAGSWMQLALIAHRHLQSTWYTETCADLELVLPRVRLIPTLVGTEATLSSSGYWNDADDWVSFLAYSLPVNIQGHRYRPALGTRGGGAHAKSVKAHVQHVIVNLRTELSRQWWSSVYSNIVLASAASDTSKLHVVSQCLQKPGPPLHSILEHLSLPSHRAAVASFLCADWFLGKYSNNYFAKCLLPRTRAHFEIVCDAGATPSNVCLTCWHYDRVAALEDEYHIVCVCPAYAQARQRLRNQLSYHTQLRTQDDMHCLFSNRSQADLQALGEFMARTRQRRRRNKVTMERLSDEFLIKSFAGRRAAWRLQGRHSCRHGVLFLRAPDGGCKCMAPESLPEDWHQAKFMPALDHRLKTVTAAPFNMERLQRLAAVQSQARRLGW